MTTRTKQDDFIDEGMRLLEDAEKQDIILRVMGAIAIRHHCPDFRELHQKMGREISDIDYVGYEKQSDEIEDFFKEQGYKSRVLSYSYRQVGRMIFFDEATKRHVDVFLDKLAMCHTIDFSDRLEIDYPTIPLAEILLQKTQIIMLSDKDVIDTMVMFREHDVGASDEDMINIDYIAGILARDWGFYHTVTTNLQKVKDLLPDYYLLTDEDRQIIADRIDRTITRFEEEPKRLKWKIRSKIGTRMKWYKDVYSAPKE
ncbi:MAG: hypothetical protein ACQET3_12165 [Promethearchaeati archaeon]